MGKGKYPVASAKEVVLAASKMTAGKESHLMYLIHSRSRVRTKKKTGNQKSTQWDTAAKG
jgi:hypothetical protein